MVEAPTPPGVLGYNLVSDIPRVVVGIVNEFFHNLTLLWLMEKQRLPFVCGGVSICIDAVPNTLRSPMLPKKLVPHWRNVRCPPICHFPPYTRWELCCYCHYFYMHYFCSALGNGLAQTLFCCTLLRFRRTNSTRVATGINLLQIRRLGALRVSAA